MSEIIKMLEDRKNLKDKLENLDKAISEKRAEIMINALAEAIHEYFGSINIVVEDRNLKWLEYNEEQKLDISRIKSIELTEDLIKVKVEREYKTPVYIDISEYGVDIYDYD